MGICMQHPRQKTGPFVLVKEAFVDHGLINIRSIRQHFDLTFNYSNGVYTPIYKF